MWLISIQTPQPFMHLLSEALEPFSDSVAILEDKVQVLTKTKPLPEEIETFVKEITTQNCTITIEEVPDMDWVAENQKTFTPITIGKFYIHDAHHQDHLPLDKICMQIDAATAFGTGHHGTTQGCLEALAFLHREGNKFKHIIDIGTGTGILAIACTKLFNIPVIATDNDAEAIRKASENMRINRCEPQVMLVEAEGLSCPELLPYQPFDLVIANILANTLIDLAPSIAKATRQGSILILSGLLQEQADSVLNAFRSYDFDLIKMITHGEWVTLILTSLQ